MLALFLASIDDLSLKAKFEDIYYTYKDDMLKIIYSILKNESDSEIALSNAFFAICKGLDKLIKKEECQLKPIVRKIARNSAINLYNKNKKSKTVSIDSLNMQEFDTKIDDSLENAELYDRLLSKIRNMPYIYKDTLYLYYISGFSTKEIAVLLGRNKNTVKAQLQRGTKQLRDYLKEVGYND
ncbi:MAG: sigma-70 family RNA polymerase sigma factor [Ruminococcaceae bacterium]|nr:sigma-70 family RNA polymerase sigma factor [Oscillospiraceae bacterium]